MNNKLRIFLILLIAVGVYLSTTAVGYALWELNQPPAEAQEDIDVNVDDHTDFTGVTISNTKALKVGVFFFEENEANTETGTLQFTISLDRDNLPSDIKNSSFTMNSYLSFNASLKDDENNPVYVIKGSTLDSVLVNDALISDDDISIIAGRLYTPINVSSTDTSIVIDYVFNQQLVLNYADALKTNTFELLITYSKDGE